jgi:uncharacterized RDD family membrane protein YckC
VQPQLPPQLQLPPHLKYATLGWRALAVLVDTFIVLIASSIVIAALMAAGVVDIGLTGASTLPEIFAASRTGPTWLLPVEYALVFAYFTLFELGRGTPGKRLCRLAVVTDDLARPSAGAVVVRNLVRLPEMYLLYLPSAVSCAASARRKRLGDFAAHTVVLRAAPAPAYAAPGRAAPGPAPVAPAPAPALGPPAGPPPLDEALAALKTAALAVSGAHATYLRFSEIELARPAPPDGAEAELSPDYAAAWYTLADAVIALQQAHAVAQQSAAREGITLVQACEEQGDLRYLFRRLEPYFTAASDEDVHEAFLRVARSDQRA